MSLSVPFGSTPPSPIPLPVQSPLFPFTLVRALSLSLARLVLFQPHQYPYHTTPHYHPPPPLFTPTSALRSLLPPSNLRVPHLQPQPFPSRPSSTTPDVAPSSPSQSISRQVTISSHIDTGTRKSPGAEEGLKHARTYTHAQIQNIPDTCTRQTASRPHAHLLWSLINRSSSGIPPHSFGDFLFRL